MSTSRFCIEIKHDTKHKKWRRLSVITLSPEALDGDAYRDQFARDNQMNPDQLAWRILEVDPKTVGVNDGCFIRVVSEKKSAASANRPGAFDVGVAKASDELRAQVLSIVYEEACIQKLDGYQLLAAKLLKNDAGIFIIDGEFGLDEFQVVLAEAKAAGLKLNHLYVYGRKAAYAGPVICFSRFDEIGIQR